MSKEKQIEEMAREMQSIDNYEFNDVQDAIYNALNDIVYEKVFGSGEKGGAE